MIPSELKQRILDELDRYLDAYESPPGATTVGVPWSKARVAEELAAMRPCIVDPYLADFVFHDTVEQISADPQIRKQCWVVAEDARYRMFLDPDVDGFGLAQEDSTGEWVTIGVRGDPIGTFIGR